MRAAENRRWILRSTNDGITALIDPAGRIMSVLPPFKEGTLQTRYSLIRDETPYTRYGDWFALACAAAGVLALAARPYFWTTTF
jgi:apolipoprotein N-acyltransferase